MGFKERILKDKKYLAGIIVGLIIGLGVGISNTPSMAKVNETNNKVTEISAKVEEKNNLLASQKEQLDNLSSQEKELEAQKSRIIQAQKAEKENQERIQRENELKKQQEAQAQAIESKNKGTTVAPATPKGEMVWKTATGSKYHRRNNCGNTNPSKATQITISEAQSFGLSPCKKCF